MLVRSFFTFHELTNIADSVRTPYPSSVTVSSWTGDGGSQPLMVYDIPTSRHIHHQPSRKNYLPTKLHMSLIDGRAKEDRKQHYHLRLQVAQSAWVLIMANGQHRLVRHHMPTTHQVETTAPAQVPAQAQDPDSMEDTPRVAHRLTTTAANTAEAVATSSGTPEHHPAILPIAHDHQPGHNNPVTAMNYPHDHRQLCIPLRMAAEVHLHDGMDRERIREKVADQVTRTRISLPIKLIAGVRHQETVIETEIGNGVVVSIGGTTDITISRRIAKDGSIGVTMKGMAEEEEEVAGMITETGARMGEVVMMSEIESGMVGTAEMVEMTEMEGNEGVTVVVVVEDYTTTNEEAAAKARSNIARRGVGVQRGGTEIETEMEMEMGTGMHIGDKAGWGYAVSAEESRAASRHCLTAEMDLIG